MLATLEQGTRAAASRTEPIVARIEGVNKNYGSVRALQAVDFTVRAGELVALLGPNGAGKTTAIKLLLGLMPPTSGKVRVFGGDPMNPANRVRTGAMLQVGRVPETLRVREHIDLFSSYYPNPMAAADVLVAAGLEKIAGRKYAELSGGQKQRVLFALAICGNPDLLFLDEPTVGLDVEARRLLWDEIRALVRRGKTVLLTTHYLQEADALADRIAVIHEGRIIAEGTPAEIKARSSGKRIRCITGLSTQAIREIPGVTEVKEDREAIEIRASETETVVRELLARDRSLSGLEITTAGLEDAFLALTQESTSRAPQVSH
ncbi:MAG TPA: ABC transporter ATP-binding protein [Candidatus Sulfotelmatobacter sp.]|nr:ABC transporter ATP-binding protein [Candidatus Sulfotelmatobacter sp.]